MTRRFRLHIIIFSFLLLPGCHDNPVYPDDILELELLEYFPLSFPGPSGLALDPGSEHLWSVSDVPGGSIYSITFTGEIIDEILIDSEDMEGIVVHPVDHTLWVVEERSRELVNVSRKGTILNRVHLNIERQYENDGLEGITINPNNGHFFVVNEKNPRLLIELNSDVEIINKLKVDFTGIFTITDLSGITFNTDEQTLWILSIESEKIVVTDLQGESIRMYNTYINDGEGIALNPDERIVYIVSDDEQMLYVFSY